MASSDPGALALRLSTLLVLTAITIGLLVWYGSHTASAALAALPAAAAASSASLAAATVPGAGDLVVLAHHREPWEAQYMYGVSALAGCWVLARLASHWRLDPRTLALEPRADDDTRAPERDAPAPDPSQPDRAGTSDERVDEPAPRTVADGGLPTEDRDA